MIRTICDSCESICEHGRPSGMRLRSINVKGHGYTVIVKTEVEIIPDPEVAATPNEYNGGSFSGSVKRMGSAGKPASPKIELCDKCIIKYVNQAFNPKGLANPDE